MEYLQRYLRYNDKLIAALTPWQVDGSSVNGLKILAELLRDKDPARARSLLERAFPKGGDADVPAELHRLLTSEGDQEAAEKLLQQILALRPDFVKEVAERMEKRGSGGCHEAASSAESSRPEAG